MAPHRALTVPDVLHEVFKYFATHLQLTTHGVDMVTSGLPLQMNKPTNEELEARMKMKRRTLAHAALTCKAFAEPASRVLWAVQGGLGPIVTVLKNARRPEGEEDVYDWARFEHVARRVRALYTEGDGGLRDGNDTLDLICAHYSDRPIFPNLRALVRYGSRPLDALLLRRLCASPALLFVDIREHDATVGESLAVISEARPDIIHLHTPCLTRLDEVGHRAFSKFTNLHTAEFNRINDALFSHLGTLPRLRMLHGAFTVSEPNIDIETAFPALQELIVDDEEDNEMEVCFLSALSFISPRSPLALLSIRVSVSPDEDMLEYLDEVCAAPALAHLRELELAVHVGSDRPYEDDGEEDESDDDESVDFADVLSRLQRLPELKIISVFVVSMVAEFSLEDKDLEAIAETWPDLVQLEIGFFFEDVGPPGSLCRPERIYWPSLGAVVSLAERCRKLKSVNIEFESVDTRALEELEVRAAACTGPQTALRQIIQGPGDTKFCRKLNLADPARVAAALRKLFPNIWGGLEIIEDRADSSEGVRYRGWDASDTTTDMFRLIKALEDSHLDG